MITVEELRVLREKEKKKNVTRASLKIITSSVERLHGLTDHVTCDVFSLINITSLVEQSNGLTDHVLLENSPARWDSAGSANLSTQVAPKNVKECKAQRGT